MQQRGKLFAFGYGLRDKDSRIIPGDYLAVEKEGGLSLEFDQRAILPQAVKDPGYVGPVQL